MVALCIALLGGVLLAEVPADRFTLSWTHSVERIEWQEDWRVDPDGLTIGEARIRGHGAGMEVPDGATLQDGWWRYQPSLAPLEQLVLANSDFTADYRLCTAEGCRPLSEITGVADRPIVFSPCS